MRTRKPMSDLAPAEAWAIEQAWERRLWDEYERTLDEEDEEDGCDSTETASRLRA